MGVAKALKEVAASRLLTKWSQEHGFLLKDKEKEKEKEKEKGSRSLPCVEG